jgi:hypothetical protein
MRNHGHSEIPQLSSQLLSRCQASDSLSSRPLCGAIREVVRQPRSVKEGHALISEFSRLQSEKRSIFGNVWVMCLLLRSEGSLTRLNSATADYPASTSESFNALSASTLAVPTAKRPRWLCDKSRLAGGYTGRKGGRGLWSSAAGTEDIIHGGRCFCAARIGDKWKLGYTIPSVGP